MGKNVIAKNHEEFAALSDENIQEIAQLHDQLTGLYKKSVVLIFEIGKRLTSVKEALDHGEFLPWIEQNCSFTPRTAQNYMQVFTKLSVKYATVAHLEDLTIAEAYHEAGIKKLAAPEHEPSQPIQFAGEPKDDFLREHESLLNQKTLSGIKLTRYAVDLKDDCVYMFRPELGYSPAIECYAIKPPGAEAAHLEMLKNVTIAMEIYFSKLEMLEDQKITPALQDHRYKKHVKAAGILAESNDEETEEAI